LKARRHGKEDVMLELLIIILIVLWLLGRL
jgi:hypothetical protein